ncbi:MAG: HupE/UreJ family protein [Gammaproteobacteria bacterium]
MSKQRASAFSLFLLLSAVSTPVFAHSSGGVITGFTAGFIHPWLGLDHLLAMSAVGLWAALAGGRCLWLLPGIFLTAMAGGALLGYSDIAIDRVELWVAFSVFALGVILAFGRRLSTLSAAVCAALFALGHGYVHGAEIGTGANAHFSALGFLLATALLHATGMAAGLARPAASKALRTCFAVICTLTGAALLAGA